MSEEVEREDGMSKGSYRIVVDGHEAEMTYSRAGQKLIIIDHTDIPAALRGRKIGEQWSARLSRMRGGKASGSSRFAHSRKRRSNAMPNGRISCASE